MRTNIAAALGDLQREMDQRLSKPSRPILDVEDEEDLRGMAAALEKRYAIESRDNNIFETFFHSIIDFDEDGTRTLEPGLVSSQILPRIVS